MRIYRYKVASKFQSIEVETDTKLTKQEYQDLYDECASLEIRDEDRPQRNLPKADAPKRNQANDKPASEAQLKLLARLGIRIPNNCTMQQARALIMKHNNENGTLNKYSDTKYTDWCQVED